MKKSSLLVLMFFGLMLQSCTSFPPFEIAATEMGVYENGQLRSNDALFFPLMGDRSFVAKVTTKTDLISEIPKFLIYTCNCARINSVSEILQIPESDSLSIEVNGILQVSPKLIEPIALNSRNAELKFRIQAVRKLASAQIGLYLYILGFTKVPNTTNEYKLIKDKSFAVSIN